MIKRSLPFLFISVLFLVASCGTSVSQNGYVVDVEPAITQLSRWQTHYLDFETLLTAPGASPAGFSRIEMIELYNMATEYKITREDYVDMGFLPLDALVGDANKFAREGHSIEDILASATPDEEIQASHDAVLKCVQTRVAFAEKIAAALRNLEPVDLSGDVSVCLTFEADLEKLTDYVKEHQ